MATKTKPVTRKAQPRTKSRPHQTEDPGKTPGQAEGTRQTIEEELKRTRSQRRRQA